MTVKEFDAKVAQAVDEKLKTELAEMSKNIPAQIADIIKDTLTDQANRNKENAKGFPVFMTNKDKPAPGTFEFDETGLEFGKVVRAMATARFTQKPAEASIDILKGWAKKALQRK